MIELAVVAAVAGCCAIPVVGGAVAWVLSKGRTGQGREQPKGSLEHEGNGDHEQH